MSTIRNEINYSTLNNRQCCEILEGVFSVLEKTGCLIRSSKAKQLLEEAGCKADGENVLIPRDLIIEAIKSTPSELSIYDRNGSLALDLADGNMHFGPAISTVFVRDVKTGEKRRGTRADAVNAALLCDALPNVSWASAMSGISDGFPGLEDIYEVEALLKNTHKPIMYWASNLENLKREIELLETVAGSSEKLKEKPFSICLVCPADPLVHQEDALEQIMYLAEIQSPVVYIAGVSLGCTSPITVAGSLVVGIADTLVGLLVSQLTCEGAPFILSRFSDNFDMSKMNISRAQPGAIKANAAAADVLGCLKVPFCSNFGDTDSGIFDQAAVFDISMQAYTGACCGANMIMGLGGAESCNMINYSFTVFANEAIGYIKTMVGGVAVDDDSLCLDSISSVGPGGDFLAEEETVLNFREGWQPELLKARTIDDWKTSGKRDLADVFDQRVNEIISAGTQNPLDHSIEEKIDKLMSSWEK